MSPETSTAFFIDTHCHFNFLASFPNVKGEIELAKTQNVQKFFVVGVDLESSREAVRLSEEFDEVEAVVGFHPTYCAGFEASWIDEIRALAAHPKVRAIGEIGLDFHWKDVSLKEMELGFRLQIELAQELRKPMVLHCREAYSATLDILEQVVDLPSFVFHCFAGNEQEAKRAMKLDAYFGVDGPITFPKSMESREVLKFMPKERILLETDSPFLSPVPLRGKPNSPANLPLIAQMVANVLEISAEEVGRLTSANAKRFFRF